MANLYMLIDEKKDFALFKVGYASHLQQRLTTYGTNNAGCELIDCVQTRNSGCSKLHLEKKCHEELKALGYNVVNAKVNGQRTEWIKVEYTDSFYQTLKENGFKALKTTAKHIQYNMDGSRKA